MRTEEAKESEAGGRWVSRRRFMETTALLLMSCRAVAEERNEGKAAVEDRGERTVHRGAVTSLAVGPDSLWSASQAGVVDEAGELVVRPRWRVTALAAARDGLFLAGGIPGERGFLAFYDRAKGEVTVEREVAADMVHDVAVDLVGEEVSWGEHGGRVVSLPLGELQDGRPRERLAHEGTVRALAYRPGDGDGAMLASGGLDGSVILHAGRRFGEGRRLQEHTAGVESVAFSLDGKWLASGSRDARVRLHRVEDGRLWRTYAGVGMEDEPAIGRLEAQVLSLCWVATEAGGSLLAGSSTGGLYALSGTSSEWRKVHQLKEGAITALAAVGAGELIMGCSRGEMVRRKVEVF